MLIQRLCLLLSVQCILAQLVICLYKLVFSVCLDVNQGGRNRNCCIQRLVIVHSQTY